MNRQDNLPADLAELERALGSDGRRVPGDLRTKVLGDVRRELESTRSLSFWRYAAAVAASVVVMLNVSLSASRSSLPRPDRLDVEQMAALRTQIEQLDLGLSDEEVARQCILLAAGRNLVPYCQPYGMPPGQTSSDLPD